MLKALVTGCTGQTGSYLTELLIAKGYDVHGLVRRSSRTDEQRRYISHLPITLHDGDVTDSPSLYNIMKEVMPDEVYHLAGQSHVKVSFQTPLATADINALGTLRLLEAIRYAKPDAKFYNAATSEMFGAAPPPQSEETPFHPVSPYSVAKLYGYWATRNYRETYGLFGVNGILFNHESPRRGVEFLSRKVARGVADIAKGKSKELRLGTLDAMRDWGHARDYVRAIYLMMQYKTAEDWVVGMGESHSVQEFVEKAFKVVDLDWTKYVIIDPSFKRANEVTHLKADAGRARHLLGWSPEYTFDELVDEMVRVEMMEL